MRKPFVPPRPTAEARKDAALAVFAGELQRLAPGLPDRTLVEVPIGWLRAARAALTAGIAE